LVALTSALNPTNSFTIAREFSIHSSTSRVI
jgi:hypothetical protein